MTCLSGVSELLVDLSFFLVCCNGRLVALSKVPKLYLILFIGCYFKCSGIVFMVFGDCYDLSWEIKRDLSPFFFFIRTSHQVSVWKNIQYITTNLTNHCNPDSTLRLLYKDQSQNQKPFYYITK